MADRAKALVVENAPWRSTANPMIVLLQGAVLLAIGLFMLLMPQQAQGAIRLLIGLVLLIMSAQQVMNAFRNPLHPFMPFQMLRGGIGATVGLLVLLQPIIPGFNDTAGRIVLGLGMLVVGLIALVGVLFTRENDFQFEAVISAALTIAFGLVLLFATTAGTGASLLGWVAALGGVGMLVVGFLNMRSDRA